MWRVVADLRVKPEGNGPSFLRCTAPALECSPRYKAAKCSRKEQRNDAQDRHLLTPHCATAQQSPGASVNTEEKLVVARQLYYAMKVDVIEAAWSPISSFPVTSRAFASDCRSSLATTRTVVGLRTRAGEKDIDRRGRGAQVCQAPAHPHRSRREPEPLAR